jgi:addiction module HigA family antidote
MAKIFKPIPPGEILFEEFMKPMGISQNKLGRDIDVHVGRINEIIHGKRVMTPDTALRLAAYFRTTPEFWMNLQSRYDLKIAKRKKGAFPRPGRLGRSYIY